MASPKQDINKMCQFCEKSKSNYCCPRCGLFYCSLKCYQHVEHVLCSESFYKNWIEETTASENDSYKTESQKKMYEILKRVHQNDVIDSDDECDEELENSGESSSSHSYLESKLDKLNLENFSSDSDFNHLWETFTLEERQKIEEELEKSDFTEIMPTWKPWWEIVLEKKLVEEMNPQSPLSSVEFTIPLIEDKIPSLDNLTKIKPSPTVIYNLINLLGSYVYVTRRYNGDYHNEIFESVPFLHQISGNLSLNKNYGTLAEAIFGLQENLNSFSIVLKREELVLIMQDLCKILEGSMHQNSVNFAKSALSDISRLLKVYKKEMKGARLMIKDHQITSKMTNMTIKKLEYFLSWVYSYSRKDEFTRLIPELHLLCANIVENDSSFKQTEKKNTISRKVLIQEL